MASILFVSDCVFEIASLQNNDGNGNNYGSSINNKKINNISHDSSNVNLCIPRPPVVSGSSVVARGRLSRRLGERSFYEQFLRAAAQRLA